MIVTFDKEILSAAVAPAMSAVSGKNTITSIEGICITAEADGTCILNSFDLEKGIRCTLTGRVEEPGSYIINGQKLNQIIRAMPEDIRIEVGETMRARITSGKSEFTINAMPGDEFPNMPSLEGDWGFTMPQCELRDAMTKTLYAVAVNEPRPALNGIFFKIHDNRLTLVSSDSFRLAICEKEMKFENNIGEDELDIAIIVPGKTVAELLKMLHDDTSPVSIRATGKHIMFSMDNICFFSRLIDAEYVNYEKFIPKTPATYATLSCDALRESLERASLVTEEKSAGQSRSSVKFTFEDQILKVSAVSVNGTVNEELPIEKTGPDLKIGFNCRYLLDALRACDSEYIRLALVSPLVSMVITADESKMTEEEIAAFEKKKENTGILSEHYTHLAVPCHLRE
ncbi:MAG: DNA polymerase III subunit beta [Ruminococcaceae bacterium]|nr:DNA polymerase III subunit beta [Oscillospiraceae bacterium]